MGRSVRATMGKETVSILKAGNYVASDGGVVHLFEQIRSSVTATIVVRPEDWPQVHASALMNASGTRAGKIEVTGETTLAALQRLVASDNCDGVAALNFASAKNPGGGFLSGAQAQEESLARCSGLYASLLAGQKYYEINRKSSNSLYTDHAILSPNIAVFRDDDGVLLPQPYYSTFITMPAVNLRPLSDESPFRVQVPEIMRRRMDNVFALAASRGHRSLVLGAWGCGVFRNDPSMIASLFAQCLTGDGSWRSRFERIVFAVYDASSDGQNRAPFDHYLSRL